VVAEHVVKSVAMAVAIVVVVIAVIDQKMVNHRREMIF
jgi:hypothetical protein